MTKTTLELPTDLIRRVKARAAEQGRSMKSLVTEALENTLRPGEPARSAPTGWRAVFGRAKPGSTRDVDRRIDELRRVDPEDWE
jgi:plasmid stability protein